LIFLQSRSETGPGNSAMQYDERPNSHPKSTSAKHDDRFNAGVNYDCNAANFHIEDRPIGSVRCAGFRSAAACKKIAGLSAESILMVLTSGCRCSWNPSIRPLTTKLVRSNRRPRGATSRFTY